jgi:anaerobic selenocysteine-containing dehydrogenase
LPDPRSRAAALERFATDLNARRPVREVRGTCSLCEACCGAIFELQGDKLLRVKADRDDPLSLGFICPKGAMLPQLDDDPDRLRTPMLRRDDELVPVSWDEAFQFVAERVDAIVRAHGRQAFAAYVGNAAGHSLELYLYVADFLEALGTMNVFTAGMIDQVPRQAVSALVWGSATSVTIPDLDRCKLLWIIGANPAESNGSLLTAPGIMRRLDTIKKRGGRIVVFDPRLTLTARRATKHVPVRPSSDAALLAAVAHVLLKEGPPQSRALDLCGDVAWLEALFAPFPPEAVADTCGIPAATITELARELRDSDGAAVYGRMGTTTQGFSTLLCWLMDVVNILAGNIDQPGGAMFTAPLYAQENTIGKAGSGEGKGFGRWHSRVSKAPEVLGELPLHCLPEEIETAGEGQVRALFAIAGNPALSNPDSVRFVKALKNLQLLVSVDIYVNETNRHADVILPGPSRLAKPNYDVWFYQFAVRHYGRYSLPARRLHSHERSEREILLRLMAIAQGLAWDSDIDALEHRQVLAAIATETQRENSAIQGQNPAEILASLQGSHAVERRLDFNIRIGPHGDGFGARTGISLHDLIASPQGLDLGPLEPRLPDLLRTPSGKIELLHPFVESELERLLEWMKKPKPEFVLVGERQLRSNNSWMHNLPGLSHRNRRCALSINSADAKRLRLAEGGCVRVGTATGAIVVPARVSDDIARGVVSLPHGWGHEELSRTQRIAAADPGANVNLITSGDNKDPITGTSQVNGFTVTLQAVE